MQCNAMQLEVTSYVDVQSVPQLQLQRPVFSRLGTARTVIRCQMQREDMTGSR
jgi:hypothetical protein